MSKIFHPGRVRSAIFDLGLDLENFPSCQKNSQWVGSKSTRLKDGLASYLLRAKIMLAHLYYEYMADL